jgi:hypothetical protein
VFAGLVHQFMQSGMPAECVAAKNPIDPLYIVLGFLCNQSGLRGLPKGIVFTILQHVCNYSVEMAQVAYENWESLSVMMTMFHDVRGQLWCFIVPDEHR